MARTVKEEEYANKRNEILDTTQRLIYTKGYEQMSIQDIILDLKISKGAFYHYFNSKQDLLDALIDRMRVTASEFLEPIINDPSLSALQKLDHFFSTAASWKAAQKDYMMAILRVWYMDDNTLVRQKWVFTGIKWIVPMMAVIIHQGIHEGVFKAGNPELAGEVVVSLMITLGETVARRLLEIAPGSDEQERAECLRSMQAITDAYTEAVERVLGAPPGSVFLFGNDILEAWVKP